MPDTQDNQCTFENAVTDYMAAKHHVTDHGRIGCLRNGATHVGKSAQMFEP